MVFAPSMMQKFSGNAVVSDASPCKSWSEDFVATAPSSSSPGPPPPPPLSMMMLLK